jgi:hypothetical protein
MYTILVVYRTVIYCVISETIKRLNFFSKIQPFNSDFEEQ